MIGAIYGDKAGSIYEYSQFSEIKSIEPEKLILDNSFYSDDTIETIAVMDAIMNGKDYESTLKEYILKYENYSPNFSPYFEKMFSPGTIKWAHGEKENNSKGNGAMMRISPVGYLFNTEKDVISNARAVTMTSHNTDEAIDSATKIALMIYYFRNGYSKEEVFKKLNLYVNYQPFTKFNMTCSETLNNCLYAIWNSTSFEDAIYKTLLMGGDTDTNSCIVGSVAEAMYGLTEIEIQDALNDLPNEFKIILKKYYDKH